MRSILSLMCLLCGVLVVTASPTIAGSGPGLCCPADLSGDGDVTAADLGVLLGAWGTSGPGDLDDSGLVDAADLGVLLGAWGACPSECPLTMLVGLVQFEGGAAVEGAVIVTDQGGSGVSRADGSFAFEVSVPEGVTTLHVSAVTTLRGVTYSGSKLVSPIAVGGVTDAGTISVTEGAACAGDPTWLPGFGLRGMDHWVYSLAVFDDGSGGGPALYAGGRFSNVWDAAASRIAKWDGTSWSPLGEGVEDGMVFTCVFTLAVFDDGSGAGPSLYAGGDFKTAGGAPANRIAKWNGTSWSPLGEGAADGMNGPVTALAVFDDGSGGGPALYAGGNFTTAGAPANRIAKWNGTSWSPLGAGTANGVNNKQVFALAVFDDGSGGGPALYAGGSFTTAGGAPASRIAKWDGTSWSPLGDGIVGGDFAEVSALAVFDDGSGAGPALYAGGYFITAGGAPASRVAKWDGASWSPLETGEANSWVQALKVFDDGSGGGPALYAGGYFTAAGGVAANRIAKWNGTSWSPLGTGMGNDRVFALTAFEAGSGGGPALYAGGYFTTAGGATTNHIASWNNATWSHVGQGTVNGMNKSVSALTVFDDGLGGGPALYAGGYFTTAGDAAANLIAQWDGTSWSPLGQGAANGVNGTVVTLAVFDDGSGGGPALYAGGLFATAGGAAANYIAKWNGTSWSPLVQGAANGVNGTVRTLAVFDDGSGGGPALYVGGDFTTAGGATANYIAKWNGTSWSPLVQGAANGMNDSVSTLAVFDDGSGAGPALYAGGLFTTAGGATAKKIAKWNGTSWSPLGQGAANGMNISVRTLAVFDDGSGAGPALYAGGLFTTAGGATANRIAKWNGTSWSPLGQGAANGLNSQVATLAVFDDGSGAGSALYAGGNFTTAGGVPASRIARWDGTSWSPLGPGAANGMNDFVLTLAVFDDGSGGGPSLYAGGEFKAAGGATATYIAQWGCDPSPNDAPRRPQPSVGVHSPPQFVGSGGAPCSRASPQR